jgi:hypothetical protein
MEKPVPRNIYIFAPVLLSLIGSAVVNLQLFQDGSSYLFELLVSLSAIRHHRISVIVIQLPTVVADRLLTALQVDPDSRLQILRLMFSLSYSSIPLISLNLSWLVLRNRNEELFIWPALIILCINLVNFSWVSELLIALQLACPLLLASILIPGTKLSLILTIALLPVVFFLHSLVSLSFFAIAAGAAYVSYKKGQIGEAARLGALIFVIAGVLRGIVSLYLMNPYESIFLQWETMRDYLFATSMENRFFLIASLAIGLICLLARSIVNRQSVVMMILSVILSAYVLGVVLFLNNLDFLSSFNKVVILLGWIGAVIICHYHRYRSYSLQGNLALLYIASMNLAAIAGFLLLSQYFSSSRGFPLKTGLTLFAFLCIALMASADSLREMSRFERTQRLRLVATLSCIFALVTTSKSLLWYSSVQKLRQTISMTDTSCAELTSQDFSWLQRNPYRIIYNWSLPTLALVVQDTRPRKLVLEEHGCQLFDELGVVQIDPWTSIPKSLVVPPLN